MANIIFTGGGKPKGAYIVAKLEEAGHNVFSMGRGDRDQSMNFSVLHPSLLSKAKTDILRKFNGLPDIIVHNARTTSGNVNHAFYCNINARMTLDGWAVGMLEGKDNPFRSIHIMGWSPKWAIPSYPALVCEGAQLAMPLAFVKQRDYYVKRAQECAVLRARGEKDFNKREKDRKKDWDHNEEATKLQHKKRKLEYEKRPFPVKEFHWPETVWVPNTSAAGIIVSKHAAENNAVTKEAMAGLVFEAIAWENSDEGRYSIVTYP